MAVHLTGSGWTSFSFDILWPDGAATGIMRYKKTNGRTRGYQLTEDRFTAADGATFDVLATKGAGMFDWLRAHARPPGG